MEQDHKEWLPHLESSIPKSATGYTLSMYTIALEAWRRGLYVKFFNNTHKKSQIRYSLSNDEKEFFFTVSRGNVVPREAVKICIDKHLTKRYLSQNGVPIPEGEEFGRDIQDSEIVEYSKTLGYPVVIKPSDGTGGQGVIANITSEGEFKDALSYVRRDLNFPGVIVEKFSKGTDHRIFVLNGEVLAAFKRIPANVVGDGLHTIKDLLKTKNEMRSKNPSLNGLPITINKEVHTTLTQKGYTLDSIPEKGERVYLKKKNNVSSGGDSTDVTDELTDEIKQIALDATNAIPGLIQCGIDMVIDTEKNTGEILEINSRPAIRNHLFPMEGKARDLPKAIVDYYFPETKFNERNYKVLYYFDFDIIADSFRRGVAKEFFVPPAPEENDVSSTHLIVTGKLRKTNYAKWVQQQARILGLNGYVQHLKNDRTSIIISGQVGRLKKIKDIIYNKYPKKFKIIDIEERSYGKPVKMGFDIKEPAVRHNKYKKEIENMRKSYEELQKERNYYAKKYKELVNSRAWKITRPIRVLLKRVKDRVKKSKL